MSFVFSLIICTFNRARLLEVCLDSIAQAEPPSCEWEVLVVDNDSPDETPRLLESFREKLPGLRTERITERNLCVARNRGCAQARGLYLVYLDDDAKIPVEYLRNLQQRLTVHMPDIMSGPVFPYYSTRKPAWFRDAYETRMFAAVSGFSQEARIATGANFIIKKSVLERLGGFDPQWGMQAGKYVIGDERKVVDAYRENTPRAEQKVFYALDCPVNHHVDPRKLRFPYFLYRFYVSGFSTKAIRQDLGEKPLPLRVVVQELAGLPFQLVRRLLEEKKRDERDYVMVCALAVMNLGELVQTGSRQIRYFLARWNPSLGRNS